MTGVIKCVLGLLAVGLAQPALAAEIPLPTAAFTAEMHVTVRDRKGVVVKLFNTPASLRYEFTARGQRRVIILDRVKKTLIVLDPRSRRYVKRPYTLRADLVAQLPPRKPLLEKIGSEKIGGIAVVKYQVKGETQGSVPFNGHLWITKDNIIVRIRGFVRAKSGSIQTLIELKKLKVAPVKPDVFAAPKDYRPFERKAPKK